MSEVLDIDLINALDAAEYIIETSAELGGGKGKSLHQISLDINRNPDLSHRYLEQH